MARQTMSAAWWGQRWARPVFQQWRTKIFEKGLCTTSIILREDSNRGNRGGLNLPLQQHDATEGRRWARRPHGRPPLELPSAGLKSSDLENNTLAEELDYNVPIGASVSKMEDVQPGDFVEVRRTGRTFSGVVLPIPEQSDRSGSGAGASLAVVVISGVLELVRSTDVMLRFPGFVTNKIASEAAPLKRDYVAASTARVSSSPSALPEKHDMPQEELMNLRQSASRDNSYMEQEPLDLARFEKRAWICRKTRHLQRRTDQEIQRIYPAFRALFLQEQMENQTEKAWRRHKNAPEHTFLRRGLSLLHRGSFTTIEATQLLMQYLAFLHDEKVEAKQHFRGESIFAMHTLFMNHPKQFLVDSTTHRHSQMFTYRSLREQQILDRVSTWIRFSTTALGPGGLQDAAVKDDTDIMDAVEIVNGFCERARSAIRWHENVGKNKKDDIGAFIAPSAEDDCPIQWTSTDKDIIEFLKISVGNRRELQDDPTGSVAMSIIKRVGAHIHLEPIIHPSMDNSHLHNTVQPTHETRSPLSDTDTSVTSAGTDLQHALVFNFLIRLGILTPWEDPNSLDTYLKNIEEIASQTAAANEESRRVLALNYDEEKRRVNYRDLPVYVIDSASAHELDDGISVESTNNGEHWIHVHIADPTAKIPPNHPLATEARQKYSSIYFPQIQWPLFPNFATYNGMSLKDNKNTKPVKQQVLTFSALVGRSGEIQDYMVRPSLVHNVQTLSYEEVNEIFLQKRTPENRMTAKTSKTTQEDLVTLARLASKLNLRRICVGGGVNAINQSSEVTISPLPLASLAGTTPDAPRYFKGFPQIDLRLTDPDKVMRTGTFDGLPGGISSENMVSEMMLLAGRVAANFSAKNNIPMPFRLQDAPEPNQVAIVDKLKNPVTGALPVIELQKNDIFMAPAYFSTVPGNHYGLGIGVGELKNTDSNIFHSGGYVRVTSPLRRYADLLSHYQIKASMLNKKMLTQSELALQFPRFERMEAWVKQIERSSHRFWIWTFVDRLLKKKQHYGEPDAQNDQFYTPTEKTLLGCIPAFVGVPDVRLTYDTLQAKIRVNLQHLGGYPVDCLWSPHVPPPPRGTILQVKILKSISAGTKRAILCAVA